MKVLIVALAIITLLGLFAFELERLSMASLFATFI